MCAKAGVGPLHAWTRCNCSCSPQCVLPLDFQTAKTQHLPVVPSLFSGSAPITPSGPSKWLTDQAGFAKKGLTGVFLSQASVMPGLCSCQGWIHFTWSAPWLVCIQRICVGT